MPTIALGFLEEDTVPVLEALGVKKMPRIWRLNDMTVLLVSGKWSEKLRLLGAAGISYNYAVFMTPTCMSPRLAGQVRYGHDGTENDQNLVPDPGLASMYGRLLPGDSVIDDTTRLRICYVCCGQDSWHNRIEHGEMHKLRLLLT